MDLSYLREHFDVVWELSVAHMRISISALLIALPIAIVLSVIGIWLRPVRQPVLWSVGFLYTIPSLAMLAFLIPSQGLGLRPTLILLVMYAQVFLVRNIITGLRGVDAATLEAARGIGMTQAQVMVRVWFPIALPVILAGVRIALVTIIGLAVLGGWVTAGGLGELLFQGISTDNPAKVLAGLIAIVALALLADLSVRLLGSLTAVARARRAAARG
ncbi:MAG TPA: ABC transporter permease [Thermomicrobiales bacterium]|jgi:osmoprotectant transport system permease protein|nr:ABC transporter permease [Thermomicrobiales bacterium]